MIVYLDGRYLPASQARIPALDPAVSWGVGLFEVTRAYNGVPFRLRDHVARLRQSARHFRLKAKLPDLDRVVRTLLRRNRLKNGYVRITLTGGGRVFVHVKRWSPPSDRSATLLTVPWRRDPRSPIHGHKTLNYFENMIARRDAQRRGATDALLIDTENRVLEGTASNVFLVKGRRIITPPSALPGVTKKVVLKCAKVEERPVRLAELLRAKEVFITNALIEVMPVVKIDGRRIGKPGPRTLEVAEAYRKVVLRECEIS